MKASPAVLLLLLLSHSGCKARAPKLEVECTLHQDCALTAIGPDCCDRCEPRVGNRPSLAALGAWCAARPPAVCPRLDCVNSVSTPMCEAGRCVARPGIH